MNLPNKITLSRIFLVPIFMIFVIPLPEWLINGQLLEFIRPQLVAINDFIILYGNYVALSIYIIAAITDGVDGYIARKRKEITQLGKFLDPIADKLLVTAALIMLLIRNDVNGWAVMIIIGREFIVTGIRLVAAGEGVVIAASKMGKLKTITQMVAIVATLMDNYPLSLFTDFKFDEMAMFLAVIITLYSGYDYYKKNIHVITPKSKR